MCDIAVTRCYFLLDWYFVLFLRGIKTQEMCDRVVSEDPFLIVYCLDKYKTQRRCDVYCLKECVMKRLMIL